MTDYTLILNIVGMLLAAGAIYGGIRVDIKHMHEKIDLLYGINKDRIDAANKRIDEVQYGRQNTD
jgi:hypothetical protein